MLKEALEYLATLNAGRKPVVVEVAGQPYEVNEDETLGEPIRPLAPQWVKPTFFVRTLSGLVQLWKSHMDQFGDRCAVCVSDPFSVQILSLDADEFGHRHVYAQATHQEKFAFDFNRFYDPESFLIAFRANFLFNDEAVKVQKLCSTVTAGNAVGVADDGISQQITITEGTVTRAAVELPADGIPLIAHRTFRHANPVASKYLLRMKGVRDQLPQIALFEIDARWRLDTIASIVHYLEKNLPPETVIVA